jgi:hypothetical protein
MTRLLSKEKGLTNKEYRVQLFNAYDLRKELGKKFDMVTLAWVNDIKWRRAKKTATAKRSFTSGTQRIKKHIKRAFF